MGQLTNWRLNVANEAVEKADALWREHRQSCVKCEIARRRKNDEKSMCGHGQLLFASRAARHAELEREQKLAKEPMPGQVAMF